MFGGIKTLRIKGKTHHICFIETTYTQSLYMVYNTHYKPPNTGDVQV